ncbi:unnamed protein product, partial [Prunus brigantina]
LSLSLSRVRSLSPLFLSLSTRSLSLFDSLSSGHGKGRHRSRWLRLVGPIKTRRFSPSENPIPAAGFDWFSARFSRRRRIVFRRDSPSNQVLRPIVLNKQDPLGARQLGITCEWTLFS